MLRRSYIWAVCLTASILSAVPATAAILTTNLTSFGADPVDLELTIDDESMPGFLTVSGMVGDDPTGDIRGLFLDFSPELSGFDLIADVVDPDGIITDRAFDTSSLPGGNNVQGAIVDNGFDSDLAFTFGSPGMGGDDIKSFTVKLSGLDVSDVAGVAVRVTSVGDAGGNREGSDKLFAGIDDFPAPEPDPIPEPATAVLIGLGLFTLAGLHRRSRR